MALDYAAAAVNAEIKDLFASGADIVQIDEPYMQARPEKAREYGLRAFQRRARRRERHDGDSSLLRLRGGDPRAAGGLFVLAGVRRLSDPAGVDRETAQSGLDCAVLATLRGKSWRSSACSTFRYGNRDA